MINKKLRPFSSLEEMNENIIMNWNSIVKKSDDVYILGDIAFGTAEQNYDCLSRLNGRLNLIYGNHDGLNQKIKGLFDWQGHYRQIKLDGNKIILFHFPIYEWNAKGHGSWHLHGHQHITGNHDDFDHPRKVNVNLEFWEYFPTHYDQIKKKIEDNEAKLEALKAIALEQSS